MKSNDGRRTRRKYTQEFKDDAVALVLKGSSVTEVARDLGIERSILNRWRNEALSRLENSAQKEGLDVSPTELARENAELRRQLRKNEQQREILKKALAIFSQEKPNGSSL